MTRAGWLLLVFPLTSQVTPERLLQPATGDWLSYSRTYDGQRHSPLRQINAANVARLRPEWIYQIQDLSAFETSPLVADGVMYISEPPSNVTPLRWPAPLAIAPDQHSECRTPSS